MGSREAACIHVRVFVLRSALLALFVACGGSTPQVVEPQPVTERPPEARAPAHRFTRLSIGADNGCVVDRSSPICWGSFFGRDARPRMLHEFEGARRIEIRSGMTGCGLQSDGGLDCFGAYGEDMRFAAIDRRTAELEEELENPDITPEREAEIEAQIAAIDDSLMPIRVAADVRDFTVFESGGCYVSDALRCWDETELQEGGLPTTRTIEGIDGDIVQLASSPGHQCALQSDGHIRCWGYGLGLGWSPPDEDEVTYTAGLGLAGVGEAVEIALGDDFTCFRRANGTVACWGYIAESVIEDEELIDEYAVFDVPGVEDARSIAAGPAHACAIVGDGRVRCWGENQFGELGTGDTRPVYDSVEVAALSGARELALGDRSTCALVGEEIRCLGSNQHGAFGPEAESTGAVIFPARGSRVLTPGYRTCVETVDGLVCTSWTLRSQISDAVRVAPFANDGTTAIDQLIAVSDYECIRRGSDLVCTHGGNAHVTLSDVAQVSLGTAAGCARMQNRRVRCWQVPRFAADGSAIAPTQSPTEIAGLTRVESVDVGARHACVVHTNGRVSCWGDNTHGVVRHPAGPITAPLELEGVTDVVQVSLDRMSTCVRKRDQTVSCRINRDWNTIELTGVVDMARGFARYLLTADHHVYEERFGRLGNRIELPDEVVEISAGTLHACARARDGRTWCWGEGSHGELGTLPAWIHFEAVTVPLP